MLSALAYAYDLPEVVKDVTWQLAVSISAGWGDKDSNKFYWGGTDSLLTIGVPIKIKEMVTVTPAFNQVWLLDSKSFFGLTLSVSF